MKSRNLRITAFLLALLLLGGCSRRPSKTDTPPYTAASEASSKPSAACTQPVSPPNAEEYAPISENGFLSAETTPLSTFAADVDTASYANFRRFVLDGQLPPADAVRIEEMVNYFHYDYPRPKAGEPLSVTTELVRCPWNEDTLLLSIGLATEPVQSEELPPQNFVFLIDVSGSMEGPDRLDLVKRAFLLLCDQLRPQDRVSIVTYASQDDVVLQGATGDEIEQVMHAIENLTAGGSTNGAAGIQTAYALAEEFFVEGGNNRIILATDGDLNVGVTTESELKQLVEQKRETGVFLSVLGFGDGNLKDNKLQALAENGNGNYSYIDSVIEARRALVREMGATLVTVAKDVKLQVEFNPAAVRGYRLIGYESRLLSDQDFADDTKDGGELGAGHRMTALYEVVPLDSPMELGTDLKYQQSPQPGDSSELCTVAIRCKQPDADTSRLFEYPVQHRVASVMSDNLRLSSAVAEVGMLVRGSEFKADSGYDHALARLGDMDWLGDDPYVTELRYLIQRLQNL